MSRTTALLVMILAFALVIEVSVAINVRDRIVRRRHHSHSHSQLSNWHAVSALGDFDMDSKVAEVYAYPGPPPHSPTYAVVAPYPKGMGFPVAKESESIKAMLVSVRQCLLKLEKFDEHKGKMIGFIWWKPVNKDDPGCAGSVAGSGAKFEEKAAVIGACFEAVKCLPVVTYVPPKDAKDEPLLKTAKWNSEKLINVVHAEGKLNGAARGNCAGSKLVAFAYTKQIAVESMLEVRLTVDKDVYVPQFSCATCQAVATPMARAMWEKKGGK